MHELTVSRTSWPEPTHPPEETAMSPDHVTIRRLR